MTKVSWLGKLGGLVAVVGLSTVFAVAQSNSFSTDPVASNPGNRQMLTGTVTSTSQVHNQYACRRNETLQSCTLRYIDHGAKFVLLVGDKPYLLEGDTADLQRFAGGQATVTGPLVGDDLRVEAVSAPGRMPEMPGTPEHPAAMATESR